MEPKVRFYIPEPNTDSKGYVYVFATGIIMNNNNLQRVDLKHLVGGLKKKGDCTICEFTCLRGQTMYINHPFHHHCMHLSCFKNLKNDSSTVSKLTNVECGVCHKQLEQSEEDCMQYNHIQIDCFTDNMKLILPIINYLERSDWNKLFILSKEISSAVESTCDKSFKHPKHHKLFCGCKYTSQELLNLFKPSKYLQSKICMKCRDNVEKNMEVIVNFTIYLNLNNVNATITTYNVRLPIGLGCKFHGIRSSLCSKIFLYNKTSEDHTTFYKIFGASIDPGTSIIQYLTNSGSNKDFVQIDVIDNNLDQFNAALVKSMNSNQNMKNIKTIKVSTFFMTEQSIEVKVNETWSLNDVLKYVFFQVMQLNNVKFRDSFTVC